MTNISNRSPILQQVVFELRYDGGFGYLDVCGSIINKLLAEQPQWQVEDRGIGPQNAPLLNIETGAVLNFSSRKMDISLHMPADGEALSDPDIEALAQDVRYVHALLQDQLGLQTYSRIGYREWLLFGGKDSADCENWLTQLGLYRIDPILAKSYSSSLQSAAMVVVMAGTDRLFRISFSGVERLATIDFGSRVLSVSPRALPKGQREKLLEIEMVKRRVRQRPTWAAMIDVDTYLEEPEAVEPFDFVMSSHQQVLENLRRATDSASSVKKEPK